MNIVHAHIQPHTCRHTHTPVCEDLSLPSMAVRTNTCLWRSCSNLHQGRGVSCLLQRICHCHLWQSESIRASDDRALIHTKVRDRMKLETLSPLHGASQRNKARSNCHCRAAQTKQSADNDWRHDRPGGRRIGLLGTNHAALYQ